MCLMFRRELYMPKVFMLRDLSMSEGRRNEINENTKTTWWREYKWKRAMVEMKANDGKNNPELMKLECFKS